MRNLLKRLAILAATILLYQAPTKAAQSIGIDFQGRANSGSPVAPMAATESAGVVPQTHWNSVDDQAQNNTGTSSPLNDSTGAATAVTVSFNANDSWNNDTDLGANPGANSHMMNGIIKANGSPHDESFTIDGLADGVYDVYLYLNENGAGSQVNVFDGQNTATYYVTEGTAYNGSTPWVQGTNTDPGAPRPVVNYVLFSKVNTLGGSSLAFTVSHITGTDGSGVAGIQVINVGPAGPNTSPVAVTVQPKDQSGALGGNAIFSVVTTGYNPTFQWQKKGPSDSSFANIAGATSSSFTTAALVAGDVGTKYRVIVNNNVNTVTSSEASVLSVATSAIAVNFQGRTSTCCVGTDPLASTDVAGVLAQANWNNVDDQAVGENGTTGALNDASGAATAVTLTYAANDSWNNDTPGTLTTPNAKMMLGIIKANSGTGSSGAKETFTFNNVPEGIYDAYMYITENAGTADVDIADSQNHATYYVTEGPLFFDYSVFSQAVNRQPAGPRDVGNYVKFSGLNTLGSGKISLTLTHRGGTDGSGVDGLQLVKVGPAGPNTTAVAIYQQPASITVAQPFSGKLSVLAQGDQAAYQWQRKDPGASTFNNIAGATSSTYTTPAVNPTTDGGAVYRVIVSNNVNSITSGEATLTVIADTTKPTLVDAGGTSSKIRVTFSEPLAAGPAANKANYSIPGIAINTAAATTVNNPNGGAITVVDLGISGATIGKFYTLTVTGVTDLVGNVIASPAQVSFFVFNSYWDFNDYSLPAGLVVGGVSKVIPDKGYAGTGVLELNSKANGLSGGLSIPDQSGGTEVTSMTMLFRLFIGEGSGNAADGFSFNYGTDLAGTTTTSEEGSGGGLTVPFDTYDNGAAEAPAISIKYAGTETAEASVSKATLVNDRYVFVVVQLKSDGTVTVIHDGVPYVLNEDLAALGYAPFTAPTWLLGSRTGGENEACRVDSIGIMLNSELLLPTPTITFTQQPLSQTIVQGRHAKFSVAATSTGYLGGSVTYQWQRKGATDDAFSNIVGATGSTYTTGKLGTADNNARYRVLVSALGGAVASSEAVVTIIPDTAAPVAKAGGIQHKGGVQVGVSFDETVTEASAGTVANYTLSAGTITGVTVVKNHGGAVNDAGDVVDAILDVTGLTAGQSYSVTVKNIEDVVGNKMSATAVPFSVPDTKWASVGKPDIAAHVAPVGDKGFDVISGGRQYWSTYDEITFVYKEVTGDFDYRVQVIENDFASRWTRAGLAVRESTDEDHTSDETTADPAYLFSAYKEVHVNANHNDTAAVLPNRAEDNTQGDTSNNSYEANRRVGMKYGAGANDTSGWGGGGPAPVFPNVWLRLKRVGEAFTGYRSENGTDWTQIATDSWSGAPNTLLVGPGYGPENGNSFGSVDQYGTYMVQYRNFEPTPGAKPQFTSITRNSDGTITLIWTGGGTLQVTPSLGTGNSASGQTWTTVTGAASPYTFTPQAGLPILFGRILQ